MWYLWAMIGCATLCIGVPLYLVYRTDKRKKTAYDKKFKFGRFSRKKNDVDPES